MNLRDYEKQARLLFGECPGCDGCDACRIQALIGHVWESGRRSGAAAGAERSKKAVSWAEMDWTAEHREELVAYTMKVFPEWCFKSRDEALVLLTTQMEKANLWQASQGKIIKKMDWVAFMKLWLGREAERAGPGAPRQPGLFSSSSERPSRQSQRDEQREEASRRLRSSSATTARH